MRPKLPALLLTLALALSSFASPASLAAPLPGADPAPTPEDAALDEAQELLAWAYNLTPATLSLFRRHVERAADGTWRITFTGELPYPGPLGDYTVVLPPDAPPDVSWSHDNVDPSVWNTGWLSAPVWGQAQLAQAYDAIVHRKPAALEPLVWKRQHPPPEEETTVSAQVDGVHTLFTVLPPGPDDLPVADALALAYRAIDETYGIDADALAGYAMTSRFVTPEGGGAPQYLFSFLRDSSVYERITCSIASPSGEALHCAWYGFPRLRPLPAGPLDGRIQAVTEFLRDCSLAYCNAAEKADIVQRIHQAGYGEALPHTEFYDFPGPADLSEEEALAVARAALQREYAFPAEAFVLFEPFTSLLAYPDTRQWVVEFRHAEFRETDLRDIAYALGNYQVTLTADTGEALSVSWDRAGEDTGIAYTRETWGVVSSISGEKGVLPARVLPWVAELYDALSALSTRYPEGAGIPGYSAEDAVAVHTLLRANGFSRIRFNLAAPASGGIPLGVAAFRARTVLLRDLGVSRALVDAAALEVSYSVGAVTGPSWVCAFRLEDGEQYAEYAVGVDAASGELLFTGWLY